jgi:hypothetical protein
MPRGEPPPAVVCLFISAARNNGLVYDTGARAHESFSLGSSSWVKRS